MQAASAAGASGSGGNRAAKRWGPIIGVIVVVAVVIVVIVATKKDKSATASTTTAAATTAAPTTTAPGGSTTTASGATTTTGGSGALTYPMSLTDAKKAGVDGQIDWGARCDVAAGHVKVPDFYAPDCYRPFTGDNGGATSTGVTKDAITIVQYLGQENDPIIAYISDAVNVKESNAAKGEEMTQMMKYYETYYELYGRKVNFITYNGTGIANDEVSARADAAAIAQKYHPFVVFGGPALTSAFADELAARKVMCIGCTPAQPDDFYTQRDPYVWGLGISAVQAQTHVLEFIKKQLAGKNATHAGTALQNTPRKFGLLYIETDSTSKQLADRFAAGMKANGVPLAQVVAYQLNPATIQQQASQVITKMKLAGVTTIILSGDPVAPRDFTKEATAQEYFPEWLDGESALVDVTAFGRSYDQQQWAHAFGVSSLSARIDPYKFGAYAVYKWFTGKEPPAPANLPLMTPESSLFFAVAQAVGPDLTPENFKKTLFAAPPTKSGLTEPSLSYGLKGLWGSTPDYQGVDDATLIWWNPTATGIDEIRKQGTGMYEYVDGGKRYLPGQWPTEDKLFQSAGAVDIYTTPPPGEAPPSYPSPAGG